MSGAGDQKLVLSYNINWQAMSPSQNLWGQCGPVSPGATLSRCAQNMANYLEAVPQTLRTGNYAFAGFQEASHIYDLIKAAPNTLGQMGHKHEKNRHGAHDKWEISSFYDTTRYTLNQYTYGLIRGGRPFQILVCDGLSGHPGAIFINVHNAHSSAQNPSNFSEIALVLGSALHPLRLTDPQRQYQIIVVGDFNEANWDWSSGQLNQYSWTPLASDEISTEVSIDPKLEFSCCKTATGDWNDHGHTARGDRAGDYIFHSSTPAKLQIPDYPCKEYLSDHLPVFAVLD